MKNNKIFSWALYDWANSAYATIVLAGFYPIIYAELFASSLSDADRTLTLGIANSSASLFLILLAPILGLLADKNESKKKFLMTFAFIAIISTFLLSLVGLNNWIIASILFSISLFGFMLSNVFYDSMIIEFNGSGNYDSISAYGYALGYLGGGLAFVLSLLFLYFNSDSLNTFIANKTIVFIFTSFWWLIFMIPLILYWPQKNIHKPNLSKVSLKDTYQHIVSNKKLLIFLLSYWIYIDGVDTIIRMAVNYGITLDFTSSDLLIALLLIQFIGFPSTLFFGYYANRFSTSSGIKICLYVYLLITVLSYQLTSIYEFYLIAVLIGLVQGGIQSLSRSYFAKIIPDGRSSEFFGVYNMLGKFAALIGPLTVGLITYTFDSSRLGILSLSIFFIVGLYLFNKQSKMSLS